MSTSEEFDLDCQGYDTAPISDITYIVPQHEYRDIYISALSRSRDTAEKMFAGEEFKKTSLINEIPLRSSFDTQIKLPLWFWIIVGRMQWALNKARQPEGKLQTIKRARKFIKVLSESGADAAVVTHGFFMHTLLKEMKKAGFKTSKAHAFYKNGEYVVAERM